MVESGGQETYADCKDKDAFSLSPVYPFLVRERTSDRARGIYLGPMGGRGEGGERERRGLGVGGARQTLRSSISPMNTSGRTSFILPAHVLSKDKPRPKLFKKTKQKTEISLSQNLSPPAPHTPGVLEGAGVYIGVPAKRGQTQETTREHSEKKGLMTKVERAGAGNHARTRQA